MREYQNLVTLVNNEAEVANPAKDVEPLIEGIGKLHPDYEYLVLFIEPHVLNLNEWLLLPVPSEGLKNHEEAEHSRLEMAGTQSFIGSANKKEVRQNQKSLSGHKDLINHRGCLTLAWV